MVVLHGAHEVPDGVLADDGRDLARREAGRLERRLRAFEAVGNGVAAGEPPLVEDAAIVGTDPDSAPVTLLTEQTQVLDERPLEPLVEWAARGEADETTVTDDLERLAEIDRPLDVSVREDRIGDLVVADTTMRVAGPVGASHVDHISDGSLAHVRGIDPPVATLLSDEIDHVATELGEPTARLFGASTQRIALVVDRGDATDPHGPELLDRAVDIASRAHALETLHVVPEVLTKLPLGRRGGRQEL